MSLVPNYSEFTEGTKYWSKIEEIMQSWCKITCRDPAIHGLLNISPKLRGDGKTLPTGWGANDPLDEEQTCLGWRKKRLYCFRILQLQCVISKKTDFLMMMKAQTTAYLFIYLNNYVTVHLLCLALQNNWSTAISSRTTQNRWAANSWRDESESDLFAYPLWIPQNPKTRHATDRKVWESWQRICVNV